jgi:hypothetical protein
MIVFRKECTSLPYPQERLRAGQHSHGLFAKSKDNVEPEGRAVFLFTSHVHVATVRKAVHSAFAAATPCLSKHTLVASIITATYSVVCPPPTCSVPTRTGLWSLKR